METFGFQFFLVILVHKVSQQNGAKGTHQIPFPNLKHSDWNQIGVTPTLETVQNALKASSASSTAPTLVPMCASLSAEFLTPSSIYLKISSKYVAVWTDATGT